MDYPTLKLLHQALAALGVAGFLARWGWRMAHPDWRPSGLVRGAPHVMDTLLVGSGIWLMSMLSLSLGNQPWLVAKLLGLVLYIVLAWVAFRTVERRALSGLLCAAALLVIGGVVWLALTHR